MKLVFLGTPEFAATVLEKLAASRHEVLAVVAQPDRPNKRGNKIEPCEVKKTALKFNYPVYQFEKIRTEGVEVLKNLAPDVLVTAAYGQILSEEILCLAPYGVLNVHASLLPKYRGSSPVQHAILNGETVVGVTVMKTALSVDSGDMLLKKELTLSGEENTEEALRRLAPLGADAIVEALDMLENGSASYEKQNESEATHYPMLKKEDGKIPFEKSAKEIKNFIRAMNPWPGAFCAAPAGTLKVFRASVVAECGNGEAGKIVAIDTKKGIDIQTGCGVIRFLEIQPEGGKRMSAAAYANGRKCSVGEVLR